MWITHATPSMLGIPIQKFFRSLSVMQRSVEKITCA